MSTLSLCSPATLCFTLLCFFAPTFAAEPITLAGPTMGTTYSVKLAALPNEMPSAELHAKIESLLAKLAATLSTYREDSEISQLHDAAANEWIEVSPDLYAVLALSRTVQERSHGAFDVSISPLIQLWRISAREGSNALPTNGEIAATLAKLGADKWELQAMPPAVRKLHPQMRFDLNAIAPGYAVDQIALLLEEQGIQNYLVELGGEIRAGGDSTSIQPWRVGIEQPVENGERRVALSLLITKVSVATSGDYRQWRVILGKRYSHILDPRTGLPVECRNASVTVVAETCAAADAWATALFVLGPERGIELANEQQLSACFLISHPAETTRFETVASRSFHERFPEVVRTSLNKPIIKSMNGNLTKMAILALGALIVVGCVWWWRS